MKIVKSYSELPKDVQDKMNKGNVFYTNEFYNYSLKTGSKIWFLFDENYIIPINMVEKIKIKYGICNTEPLYINEKIVVNQEKIFLNEAMKCLKKNGVAWIISSSSALFNVYPDNSLRIPFGSHIIELDNPEQELLMKMNSKHRNSIRRAEKNDVIVISGGKNLINDYIKIDSATWARNNKQSYGFEYFENIINELAEKAILYIAYKNGKPQSGACYYYNEQMCYYMYGASIDRPEPGATNLLQWEAIKDMKRKGVKKFSFVGCRINEDPDSKYHGIQRFKERFGGNLVQGYMFKSILNVTQYQLFKQLYKIKNGKVLLDPIEQEIHKWPELQENKTLE